MMQRTFVFGCFLGFVWTACSSSSPSGSCSGSAPAGTTCQKASGECEALVCQGSSWGCPAGDMQVALTATSCTPVDGGPGADGGCSGTPPAGATCQKSSGGCEALVCQGSSWGCPAGDTQVALTPANCTPGDGGVDADAGCTGTPPAGATCQKPSGGCEGLVCQGSSWGCPAGDTQVALTPGSCGDGGPVMDSGQD